MEARVISLLASETQPIPNEGPARSDRPSERLQNLVVLIPVAIGFLLFCGNGYYGRLTREFGFKASILELSQVDMATMGFYSVCYAWYSIVRENAWLWIGSALAGIAIGAALVATMFAIPKLLTHLEPLAPIAIKIDNFNKRAFKWFSLGLLALSGLGGGDLAGSYDAAVMQKGRNTAKGCYVVNGVPYRARILAQDKTRAILIQSDRASIVSNDGLVYIPECIKERGNQDAKP